MLLAKSLPKDKSSPKALGRHTEDVIEAADAIFGGTFGDRWCEFFRVQDPQKFRLNLRISAATHDVGKADNGNQGRERSISFGSRGDPCCSRKCLPLKMIPASRLVVRT